MDTQTIFTITGIGVTVLVGVWAIVITLRHSKSVQITYAYDRAIALTDDITQNFPDLRVLFRDQPVSDNLVLLKGYFINTGRKDISREMIEKQITLTLPAGFEWVECKVVERSPELEAFADVSGKSEITLETGLWKVREYLKFEALARVPVVRAEPDSFRRGYPTYRLRQALAISHRIADSKSIYETRVPRLPRSFRPSRLFGFRVPSVLAILSFLDMWIPVGVVILGAFMWYAGDSITPERTVKTIGWRLSVDGQERVMSMVVKDEKVLLSDGKGLEKEYTLSEFDSISDKHPEFVATGKQAMNFGPMVVVIGIAMFLWTGPERVRDKRLLSMIGGKKKT